MHSSLGESHERQAEQIGSREKEEEEKGRALLLICHASISPRGGRGMPNGVATIKYRLSGRPNGSFLFHSTLNAITYPKVRAIVG